MKVEIPKTGPTPMFGKNRQLELVEVQDIRKYNSFGVGSVGLLSLTHKKIKIIIIKIKLQNFYRSF